jgi:hypothetical protein
VQVNPLGAKAERETVPVKPLSGLRVIVESPEAPARTVTLVGLAVVTKSVTFSTKLKPNPVVPEFPCPDTLFVDAAHVAPGVSVKVLVAAP